MTRSACWHDVSLLNDLFCSSSLSFECPLLTLVIPPTSARPAPALSYPTTDASLTARLCAYFTYRLLIARYSIRLVACRPSHGEYFVVLSPPVAGPRHSMDPHDQPWSEHEVCAAIHQPPVAPSLRLADHFCCQRVNLLAEVLLKAGSSPSRVLFAAIRDSGVQVRWNDLVLPNGEEPAPPPPTLLLSAIPPPPTCFSKPSGPRPQH